MRILVLQLARFGDIVQTVPALRALRKKHPEAEIELMVRSTFAEAAALADCVDRVVELPTKKILGCATKPESLVQLMRWLSEALLDESLKPKPEYDLVINLTFSEPASYLASLIPAKKRLGLYRDANSALIIPDFWSQYFYGVVQATDMNVLHLNDIFVRIVGCEALHAFPDTRKIRLRDSGKQRVALQASSSRLQKTPPAAYWSATASALLAENSQLEIVLLGALSDKELNEQILAGLSEQDRERTQNLAGQTSFEELRDVLSRCDFLVAPDTSTVHVAALAETPSINISMGGVRADETGPYGDENRVLFLTNQNITPTELAEAVVATAKGRNASSKFAQAKTEIAKSANGVGRNRITAINFDDEEVSRFYRSSLYLLAEFRGSGRVEETEIPTIGSPNQPDSIPRLLKAFDALCSARKAAEFGEHYCIQLESLLARNERGPKLKETAARAQEVDEMLRKVSVQDEFISPLINLLLVQKDCSPLSIETQGDDAEALATTRLAESAYAEFIQNVEITQNLLQTAVDAASQKSQKSETSEVTKPAKRKEEKDNVK